MADKKVENLQNLLALFDKPMEPLLKPKANKLFLLPQNLVIKEHAFSNKQLSNIATTRSSAGSHIKPVQVESIDTPNLGEFESMDKYESFSLFMPKHIELAAKLIQIFLDSKNFLSTATYAYERVNKYLFYYAYSVAFLHRDDTKGVNIPNQIQLFPDKYFDKNVFFLAKEQLALVAKRDRHHVNLAAEYTTASDLEIEHRLAYFREDLAVNLHHWHWHLAYPTSGPDNIIKKDRRGELFYYMHQQIIARYNYDRLCNHLKRVERLSNWNEPIEEAYFPKLDSLAAGRAYPARPKNMRLSDIDVPSTTFTIDIADMIRWRDRVYKAIDLGYVKGLKGQKIPLDIDILGNMIESSDLSPNPRYYGNLHGAGHLLLCYIHDPKTYHLERMGVMGDTATAMRDPIFYRWHAYVDTIFHRFKATLDPYTDDELSYPKINVTGISVKTEQEESENVFKTYWKTSSTELHGLDIVENEHKKDKQKVFVDYQHLQHKDFSYKITVRNDDSVAKVGTVRIFMSPTFDEAGKQWLYRHQRFMFIEMDRFKVTLQPGENIIQRKSLESSVTIPFEQTFNDPTRSLTNTDAAEQQIYGFCGCGWPHHLLVPKGTTDGFKSKLFVMVSNYDDDKVKQELEFACKSGQSGESYCGVRGGKYPDKRAMGFPFDRLAKKDVNTLDKFIAPFGNMSVIDCTIFHTNKVEKAVKEEK